MEQLKVHRSILLMCVLSLYLFNAHAGYTWAAAKLFKQAYMAYGSLLRCKDKIYDEPKEAVSQLDLKETCRLIGAEKANPDIQKMAMAVLKDCGITTPVTVLQIGFNNAYFKSPRTLQDYIVVGTVHFDDNARRLTQGLVYHEIGHMNHGHQSFGSRTIEAVLVHGSIASSILSTYATRNIVKKYITSKKGIPTIIGLGIGYGPLRIGELIDTYRQRIKEKNADAFAYITLLEHGKKDICFEYIGEFILLGSSDKKQYAFFETSTHPASLERAKMGLRMLQKYGIDIHDESLLPKDWPDLYKAYYLEQVRTLNKAYCLEQVKTLPAFAEERNAHDLEQVKILSERMKKQ